MLEHCGAPVVIGNMFDFVLSIFILFTIIWVATE